MQITFTAPTDSSRDYRAMYAALYRFHERHHTPPTQEAQDDQYLSAIADDYCATMEAFHNDPLVCDLLNAALDELNRQYNALRGIE